jgi:L,D-transpeptidase YcbB
MSFIRIEKIPACVIAIVVSLAGVFANCNTSPRKPVSDIAATPEEIGPKIVESIRATIAFAAENNGIIDSNLRIFSVDPVKLIYEKRQFASLWSEKEAWKPLGDSLFDFISNARNYGLFPEDYHFRSLDSIRNRIKIDSLGVSDRRDALVWANADVMLTDAFVHIVKDLKLGRLPQDSVTLRQDSVLTDESYFNRFALADLRKTLYPVFHSLEPEHEGYLQLKAAIPAFLKKATDRQFVQVPSPKLNLPDFKKTLQTRLYQEEFLAQDSVLLDSVELSQAVKRFQEINGITVDGKAGEETVRLMNISDRERFIRIAITLDRYKLLPEKMPERYVWVNLPGYYMKFWENDTLKLESKIICGKPATRTPLLTSAISELVTYPQWTVPASIIEKEILPAVKKNTGYLAEKGFSLVNSKGEEVNPDSVDWSKYRKGIPYKVVQGSGDANALGILKFNFPNKYAVYLHDTNQRSLFAKEKRSLSHGCVRVQNWEEMAYSIVQYDYKERPGPKPSPVEDSLTSWLRQKVKRSIAIKNRVPLYIRYFTCEVNDHRIRFHDDIYGEDKTLMERYFSDKYF